MIGGVNDFMFGMVWDGWKGDQSPYRPGVFLDFVNQLELLIFQFGVWDGVGGGDAIFLSKNSRTDDDVDRSEKCHRLF